MIDWLTTRFIYLFIIIIYLFLERKSLNIYYDDRRIKLTH